MDALWDSVCHYLSAHPWLRLPLLSAAVYAGYRILSCALTCRSCLNVKDKTVLITGASSGLGRALAFRFHRAGARLILTARSIDKLEQLCAELQAANPNNTNEPLYRYLDMAEPNGIADLAQLSPNRKIDVLVNNAGQSMRGSCRDTTLAVQRQIMDVNFFGHVAVTQALLDAIPENGTIIVVGSVQGRIAVPYRSAYGASKHAIQAYFDSMRGEEPRLNVLMVSPGYINTNISHSALTATGQRHGKAEHSLLTGMTADFAADQIYRALVAGRSELVLAPWQPRFAIFLRYALPDLYFWVMRRRAAKELEKEKNE
uniref:Dehydrogenase/reductase SDR family protein 7-like n=1 Tax=Plectus sambesii TaxID=2011161 RepID=A0A914WR35_9BILA